MNPLINIDVIAYLEVSDSGMFGGKGSVGYTSVKHEGVRNLEHIDEFAESQRKITADMLWVDVESVRLISKEDYEAATSENEEDEGFEEDEE